MAGDSDQGEREPEMRTEKVLQDFADGGRQFGF